MSIFSERLTAGGGSELIADTTLRTDKKYYAFIAQEDTVVHTLTGGAEDPIPSPPTNYLTSIGLNGKTLKQGALIVAPIGEAFTSLKLTSGSVIAYS